MSSHGCATPLRITQGPEPRDNGSPIALLRCATARAFESTAPDEISSPIRADGFLQKEKEFKDKQRKAWEQDLKKIKGEIVEIQLRFEERISTLFKKKLFFDVRIMEQELAVIRLTIMLHDARETLIDEKKIPRR